MIHADSCQGRLVFCFVFSPWSSSLECAVWFESCKNQQLWSMRSCWTALRNVCWCELSDQRAVLRFSCCWNVTMVTFHLLWGRKKMGLGLRFRTVSLAGDGLRLFLHLLIQLVWIWSDSSCCWLVLIPDAQHTDCRFYSGDNQWDRMMSCRIGPGGDTEYILICMLGNCIHFLRQKCPCSSSIHLIELNWILIYFLTVIVNILNILFLLFFAMLAPNKDTQVKQWQLCPWIEQRAKQEGQTVRPSVCNHSARIWEAVCWQIGIDSRCCGICLKVSLHADTSLCVHHCNVTISRAIHGNKCDSFKVKIPLIVSAKDAKWSSPFDPSPEGVVDSSGARALESLGGSLWSRWLWSVQSLFLVIFLSNHNCQQKTRRRCYSDWSCSHHRCNFAYDHPTWWGD